MFRKSYLFVCLLLLMLVAAPLTLAQDQTFGLSADDYALFTSPNMNAKSLGFDFAVNLNVTGAPDGDVVVDLSGSGLFGEGTNSAVVGSLTLTGTANASGNEIPVNFEMRIVDGIIYVNLGDGNGWQGQSLDDFMSQLGSLSPLPVNPMDLASGNLSDNPEAAQAMGSIMSAFQDFDPATLISMSRLDDMNGQAHFQVNVDLQSFLASDTFNQLMGAAGDISGDDSVSSMGPMIAMLFKDINLSWDEFIEMETKLIRQGVLNFGLTVDPSAMGQQDAKPVTAAFKLDLNNIQYDVPVEVTAPEGATMSSSSTSTGAAG